MHTARHQASYGHEQTRFGNTRGELNWSVTSGKEQQTPKVMEKLLKTLSHDSGRATERAMLFIDKFYTTANYGKTKQRAKPWKIPGHEQLCVPVVETLTTEKANKLRGTTEISWVDKNKQSNSKSAIVHQKRARKARARHKSEQVDHIRTNGFVELVQAER